MATRPALLPITHQRMQLQDVTIAYQVLGEGPPVVLVHGLSGSSRWWLRNVQALAQHARVYVVDLVGFGASRGQRFALDAAAGYLVAWMDNLALASASFVGHSMGGYISAQVAADYPTRVQKLILIDAAILPFDLMYLQHVQGLMHELWHLPWSFFPTLVLDALRAGPATVWHAANEVMKIDLRLKLAQIVVPTLLVWGERDSLVPVSFGKQLAHELPQSALVTIAGAGHNAMWDCSTAFNRVAIDFLADATLPAREYRIDCQGTPLDGM